MWADILGGSNPLDPALGALCTGSKLSGEQVTGTDIKRWGDGHQYASEPMPAGKGLTVTLLNATPDPLGSLAALCGIYTGRVVRDLSEVTDDQRRDAFAQMQRTVLNGPLASLHFHFLLEGVGRDVTHQAVRDNFSFIAQESLRFAVKEDFASEIPLPPFLAGLTEDDPRVRVWKKALNHSEDAYGMLVDNGVPAEEARKLLPHAVTTRYHWVPSLKTLLTEAGKRTCTQAQFDWKILFAQVAKALREYGHRDILIEDKRGDLDHVVATDGWQFELIAKALRPNCFQTGACGFMADFDRGCTIRERVEANAKAGRPVSEWGQDSFKQGNPGHIYDGKGGTLIKAIHPHEWATDPGAARKAAQ